MTKIETSVKIPEQYQVIWEAGQVHPEFPVSSGESEGEWIPNPGYNWIDDPKGPGDVEWISGVSHPLYTNVISSVTEGEWEPAPGYTWKVPRST